MAGAVVGPRLGKLGRQAGRVGSLSLPSRLPETVLERVRLVVATLQEHPGLTSRELSDRLGCGRRHTSLLLLRLEEHGHVLHVGRGWFPAPNTPLCPVEGE